MDYIDLKQAADLEKLLAELNLSPKEINSFTRDCHYYDRYLLIRDGSNIGFLTVHQQHFHDPYLRQELDNCDLVNYRGIISLDNFIEVMDDIFRAPQITRSRKLDVDFFRMRGFENLSELKPGASTLIKVSLDIREKIETKPGLDHIRTMEDKDIPEVELMFSEEYAVRYLDIARLYKRDPSSCFVYDEGSKIQGVMLNERGEQSLYSHQIKVRNVERRKGIDIALLAYANNYALTLGYKQIRGSVRGNLLPYYLRIGAKVLSEEEEQYLIRLKLARKEKR